MENWSGMLDAVTLKSVMPAFVPPTLKYPQIATRDIGRFAAEALLRPPPSSEVRQLAGPREYSVEDAAKVFSDLVKRPVHVVSIPPEGAVGAMTGAGLPKELSELFGEMYAGISGRHVTLDEGHEIHRGPTTLETVLAELVKG
jgi:uncharacterized protein YbjT (DUF2867 family)